MVNNKVYMLYYIFANEETITLGIFTTLERAEDVKFSLCEMTKYCYQDLEIEEFTLNVLQDI